MSVPRRKVIVLTSSAKDKAKGKCCLLPDTVPGKVHENKLEAKYSVSRHENGTVFKCRLSSLQFY